MRGLRFCPGQPVGVSDRVDPENESGNWSEDQRIGEDQIALFIDGSAEDVSKNDSNENDEVKKRFHTGYVWVKDYV